MNEIIIGVFSSAVSAIFTNPLVLLRNKLIVEENEAKYTYTKTNRPGFGDILNRVLVQGGGFRTLESGLIPSLAYYTVTNGIRLGFFSSMEKRGMLNKKDDNLSLVKSITVATGGAILGGFFANPLFIIKTRIQQTAGENRDQKIVVHKVIQDIFKHGGILGFFHGFLMAMPIVVLGSIAQLVTFAYSKECMNKGDLLEGRNTLPIISLSAVLSSVAVVAVTNPIDTALVAIHYQERRGLHGYRDAFRAILKADGFRGLYQGCFLSFVKVMPNNFITLIIWDYLRMKNFDEEKAQAWTEQNIKHL